MKRIQSLASAVLACGLALALTSTVVAQTTVDISAKVVRMKGTARYSRGDNNWQPVKVGTVLQPGMVIQTSREKGSFVDLALGEGGAPIPSTAVFTPFIPSSTSSLTGAKPQQNMVRVTADTALGIDKLTRQETGADVVTETQLDLKQGRILGSVSKLSPASRYEIKLPNGVAGIRGTVYEISADGIVRVLTGTVVLAWVSPNGSTQTQVVNAHQQFDPATGLVTPISTGQARVLNQVLMGMQGGAAGSSAPTTFIRDQTIYRVSPVQGGRPLSAPQPPI